MSYAGEEYKERSQELESRSQEAGETSALNLSWVPWGVASIQAPWLQTPPKPFTYHPFGALNACSGQAFHFSQFRPPGSWLLSPQLAQVIKRNS
jgi:hypothetical protein